MILRWITWGCYLLVFIWHGSSCLQGLEGRCFRLIVCSLTILMTAAVLLFEDLVYWLFLLQSVIFGLICGGFRVWLLFWVYVMMVDKGLLLIAFSFLFQILSIGFSACKLLVMEVKFEGTLVQKPFDWFGSSLGYNGWRGFFPVAAYSCVIIVVAHDGLSKFHHCCCILLDHCVLSSCVSFVFVGRLVQVWICWMVLCFNFDLPGCHSY